MLFFFIYSNFCSYFNFFLLYVSIQSIDFRKTHVCIGVSKYNQSFYKHLKYALYISYILLYLVVCLKTEFNRFYDFFTSTKYTFSLQLHSLKKYCFIIELLVDNKQRCRPIIIFTNAGYIRQLYTFVTNREQLLICSFDLIYCILVCI